MMRAFTQITGFSTLPPVALKQRSFLATLNQPLSVWSLHWLLNGFSRESLWFITQISSIPNILNSAVLRLPQRGSRLPLAPD